MEIFHIFVLGSLSLLLLNYLLNLRVFSFPANLTPPPPLPLLSVLVPARNEEKRIGPCLESLFASDYPHLEILVLDDHSSDGTADLVRHLAKQHPRLRLLHGKDLPHGWTGKAWACHQLAQEARGEFFLFADADARLADLTLTQAVSMALEKKSGLLSLWPYLPSRTWSEHPVS